MDTRLRIDMRVNPRTGEVVGKDAGRVRVPVSVVVKRPAGGQSDPWRTARPLPTKAKSDSSQDWLDEVVGIQRKPNDWRGGERWQGYP